MLITFYLIVSLMFWIYFYGGISYLMIRIFIIDKLKGDFNNFNFPKLTIIVTACNEENSIEPAIRSILNQEYPDFDVIAVDDRSTDSTGEILNRLELNFDNLKILHIRELPENWLGKVHALNAACRQAEGEWILFTDADIHFAPDSLKKCLFHAVSNELDHFTIAPKMIADYFLLEIMFRTFSYMFSFISSAVPGFFRKNMAVGVGAFNLIRRSSLEKTEGFSWLRMEVADDVGLALMLKNSGAKSRFAYSLNDVSVRWYPSLLEMARGLEKNIFGVSTGYRLSRTFVHFFLIILVSPAPFVAVCISHDIFLQIAGIFSVILLIISGLINKFRFNVSFLPSLFVPLGLIALMIISLRAGLICTRKGGIQWRGTFYKLSDLKKGQRVNAGV